MAELGTTRYGMQIRFLDPNRKGTTKSYNGINFESDDAPDKARQLESFLRGGGSYSGFLDLLGENHTVDSIVVTQNNPLEVTN